MASTYVAAGDLEYGRYGNPTWAAFEEALGALEGGRCLAFASGLAAVATVLDLVGQGAKVVAPRHAYNGTVMQLADLEARGRLTRRLVDITDTDGRRGGLRRRRAGLARVAHQPGARGRRHRDDRARPRTRPAPTSSSTTPSPPPCCRQPLDARRRPRRALGDEVPLRPQRRAARAPWSTARRRAVRRAQGPPRPARRDPRHARGLAGAARAAHPAPAGRAGRRPTPQELVAPAVGSTRRSREVRYPGFGGDRRRSCSPAARWRPTC